MLRIAICDDMIDELTVITAYINEYLESHCHDAEVLQFSHPDALLTLCQVEHFQLYILDIVMPMVNGIDLGKEIRRMDREAQIIYTTTEPGFALQSFVANPINYLIKPLEKAQFFDALALAISKVDMAEESTITVKTLDRLRVLKLPSIVCCEYVNRTAVYTLSDGETITTRNIQGSFAEHIAPLLCDRHFLQPHTSFALNMNRVEAFSREGFVMQGGKVVPIPSKLYGQVRDSYMDYLITKRAR